MFYTVRLDPENQLSVALVKNVKNVPEVRKMVMNGSLNCCIIKPSLIVDPFQVAVAAFKAVLNKAQNKLATKSINREILFNLSLSKNITQSLIKFGVGDNDTNVIVCVIDENGLTLEEILTHFDGEKCSVDLLQVLCHKSLIKKEYKITDVELKTSNLLESVVSRIAAKDFIV